MRLIIYSKLKFQSMHLFQIAVLFVYVFDDIISVVCATI